MARSILTSILASFLFKIIVRNLSICQALIAPLDGSFIHQHQLDTGKSSNGALKFSREDLNRIHTLDSSVISAYEKPL